MYNPKSFVQLILNLPGVKHFTLLLAQRFIAGNTPREALNEAGRLNIFGFRAILNFLGGSIQSKEGIKTAERVYLALLSAFQKEPLKGEISLKASELGMETDQCLMCYDWCGDCPEIKEILTEADKANIRPWLDAEFLEERENLWKCASRLLKEISFLGIAYQAYGDGCFNSEYFFRAIVEPLTETLKKGKTLGIRLCKGAYYSSEKYILRSQEKIRKRYLILAWQMIKLALANDADEEKGNLFLEFATHDAYLTEELKKMAQNLGLAKNKFRFAMLYGREQSLASHLFKEGYAVAIYLPFGSDQISYVSRRLQENWSHLFLPFRREGAYHICSTWPEICSLRR